MITLINVNQLAPDQQGLWVKAQQAVQTKNYKYAVTILKTLVKRVPGFLEGRKLLRACEVKSTPETGRRNSLFGGLRITTTRKDPESVLVNIEDELEKDPYSVTANETLFAAANDLNLPDIAAFALETICQGQPSDKKHLHLLANHYIKHEQFAQAAETYRRVLKIDHADPIAMRGEKDCAARASMKQGNWEGKGDFRTKMKNANATADLESGDKMGLTKAELETRLAQLSEQYAMDNTNLAIVKDIASVYEQMEDYANAYSFYAYAFQLGGNADVSINDKAMQMHEKAMQAELEYYEQVLAADPENEEAKANLAARKAEIAQAVVADARARVEANPTDAQLQFKLGQALFDAGEFTEAIPALQRARTNPNLRIKAMLMLGKCYHSKNMRDMAIRQLEDANKELVAMDDTKKEILYMIGILYEESGNKEKALENLKAIYEVDYGYRDVAQKVESAYS
ncbi:MAG: tetratricopeptide repeat protein [Akkermansia sp.]|nr:tetratricopeptide repeat protein [Akkermansia sp.]